MPNEIIPAATEIWGVYRNDRGEPRRFLIVGWRVDGTQVEPVGVVAERADVAAYEWLWTPASGHSWFLEPILGFGSRGTSVHGTEEPSYP